MGWGRVHPGQVHASFQNKNAFDPLILKCVWLTHKIWHFRRCWVTFSLETYPKTNHSKFFSAVHGSTCLVGIPNFHISGWGKPHMSGDLENLWHGNGLITQPRECCSWWLWADRSSLWCMGVQARRESFIVRSTSVAQQRHTPELRVRFPVSARCLVHWIIHVASISSFQQFDFVWPTARS